MKNKFKSFLRYEVSLIAGICILCIIVLSVHLPLCKYVWSEFKTLNTQFTVIKNAHQTPGNLLRLQRETFILDSLIKVNENRIEEDQSTIAASLYSIADSAHLQTSKVEISDPMVVSGHTEIPILISGSGLYSAMGKFIDGVEALSTPTRVRQITMKNKSDGVGELSLDFILIK